MNILANTLNPAAVETFNSATQDGAAAALASAIGNKLDADLAVIAKAKQDWEGGPFRCMFTLLASMTKEQVASLPDTLAKTGNNPRFYTIPVKQEGGKTKNKDRDYYKVLADNLPANLAKTKRIDMLNRSLNPKLNQSDISDDIKDLPKHLRVAEISRLSGEINVSKAAVVKAFELFWQLRRFDELKGVTAAIIYAIDPNDATKVLDGADGRVPVVENTRTPIVIRTKLEARRDTDYMMVGINTFLKFPVASIVEQGGSYAALEATMAKGKKEKDKDGQETAKSIRTVDGAAQSFTDLAEYFATIQDQSTKADWEALKKALQGAGSDDMFYNASVMYAALEQLVGDPKSKVRFQKLFSDREQAAA